MSKELEKVISKLSQKSKGKVEKKPEPEVEEEDEDLKELTEGDAVEDDEKPVPKEEKPSDEAMQKIREIEAQVERLQNDGVYRVEMLYQLQRIGDFLEKLVGGDDAKEEK